MGHGLMWYWHRLRAMGASEIRERIAARMRQRADSRRLPDFAAFDPGQPEHGAYPVLPAVETAPESLREAVRRDNADLSAGRVRLLGHFLVQVDTPPAWSKDYVSQRDLRSTKPGFQLNHRALPEGSDIRLIWELNRWHAPVRFAMAGWLLNDAEATRRCIEWLRDWCRKNPPFRGLNWTSALESGIRLINFAWIDALLEAAEADAGERNGLCRGVLASHVWYTWRHRSFGSSANNHLLGELAGLIVACARWPALQRWAISLGALQESWEREVLAQFAPDGGNREQALHYQLFAWELCWHARNALRVRGRPVSDAVEERLNLAADFYATIQVPTDAWDYGDSDSCYVTPLYADETGAGDEWYRWFTEPSRSPALHWFLGDPPPPRDPPTCVRVAGDWLVFPESGLAACWSDEWQARLDLSSLGYLSTAAHGHLDALHFSVWLGGVALIVDPGTGAYYADTRLRAWLASWESHNGPHVPGSDFPARLGPFLWKEHHERPTWKAVDERTIVGQLRLPQGTLRRVVRRILEPERNGWEVDDFYEPSGAGDGFAVTWQFAPGTVLHSEPGNPNLYRGERRGRRFTAGFDAAWTQVRCIPETHQSLGFPVRGDLIGLCSPAFRRIDSGPVIQLRGRGRNPVGYRSTFLLAA